MSSSRFFGRLPLLALALSGAGVSLAQGVDAESVPAFEAFEKWVAVVAVPAPAAPPRVEAVSPPGRGMASAARFEPLPVILGTPELPLLGAGARQAAATWGQGLNYQGVRASLLLLDDKGARAVPLSTRLKPGQRFKLRITSTFDGVAALDQVLGTAWEAERMGQVYPAAGTSVEIKAGKAAELPVGDAQYFVLDRRPANERLLLSVRHAKAVGSARSGQPAYRADNATGSSYLQLAPAGSYPIVEQLLAGR